MFNSMQEEFESTVAPIMRDILDDARKLMRQEAQLVRVEIKEESRKAQSAFACTFLGSALLFVAVLLSSFMLVYAISARWLETPLWLAFGIVAVCLALVGAGLSLLGLKRWRAVSEDSGRSLDALREGFTWMHRSA
jgi:uncharacterized membrane protein YqjE